MIRDALLHKYVHGSHKIRKANNNSALTTTTTTKRESTMIGSRAWWALMRRNVIYRRRNLMGTFLELALPVAFVAVLVAIKNAVKDSEGFQSETVNATFPEIAYTPLTFRDYATAMQATHKCVEVVNNRTGQPDFWITGVPEQGENWQVPFVKCDSRRCKKDDEDATEYCQFGVIGVSGSEAGDFGGLSRARDFTTWLYSKYPELKSNTPFDFDIVKEFVEGPQEMNDYVKDEDYGKVGKPKLVMGVIFSGNEPFDYKYSLRHNSTNFNAPESEWRPAVTTTPDTGRLFKDYAKHDEDVCLFEDGEAQQGRFQNSCTGRYLYNGILTFQRLLGDFILSDSGATKKGFSVAESGVSFAPFPTFQYEESGFFGDAGGFLAFLIALGLLYPVSIMIYYITREKEQGQKELMKMMSASESDIGWSWFASYFLFNIVNATIVSAVSMVLFENSSSVLLWMFWVITFLALTVFSMFMASFTSKTTRAIMIGLLIYFIGFVLTFAVDVEDGNSGLIGLISLHPVGALLYGLQLIGTQEDQDVGLQSSTIDSSDTVSGWTVNNSLQYLLLDSLIYGLLTWYLNRTIKDFGPSLPLWFPFTRAYWCPKSVHHHASDSEMIGEEIHSSVPFEVIDRRSGEEEHDIVIKNLRKKFGKKHAVDGLSLTMYNGQVTALLGHNGAGKTTTIKLLTGAISPTGGSATIAGKSIRSDMDTIRENIGICPQENCLFDLLTVRETIQFFARLKGVYSEVSREEAEEHVDRAIRDIALAEKCNTLAKHLSGGMKRKLSVAIAFCGGSKTVILDEPTSGMDPFSRRFTWDVIRQYRENRSILLTTHFMDEADVLGDRIAIMAEGQLRCVGSPLFLKKTYGVGYQLTIEKTASTVGDNERAKETLVDPVDLHQIDAILRDIVKSAVPNATRLSNSSTEMRYQLPIASSSSFAQMFDHLDESIQQGQISSYGVSITTMDEVFLAVAQGDTREKNELASSVMNIDSHTVQSNSDDDKSHHSANSAMDLEKEGLFVRHLGALFKKRAANFKRDKRAWLCTVILPSLFVLIGFLIATFAAVEKDLEPLLLTLDDYNTKGSLSPRNPIVFNSPGLYSCQPANCAYELVMNNTTNPMSDELYSFCGQEARLINSNCNISQSTEIVNEISDAGASPQRADVDSLEESSYSLYNSWDAHAASQYGAIFFSHDKESVTDGGLSYNDAVFEKCLDNGGDNETCVSFQGIGYVIQYNYTALHVAPLYQVLADEAIARMALSKPNFNIECTLDPLPVTSREESYGKAEDTFLAWLLIILSFPFISGAFGTFVVSERQSKSKHLQTVAGVQPVAYWLSTWLWDVMNYQIPCWATIILMFAFDVDALTSTTRDIVGGVIVLLLLFGPAAASFTYCVSFAFESPAMCNMFVVISGFLIGMGGPVAIWILHIIGEGVDRNDPNESLLNAANIVAWILRIFPTFCLSNGIYNAIYIQAWEYWEGHALTVWSDPILRIEALYLAGQAVVFLAFAILLDKWSSNPRMVSIGRKVKRVLTCRWCFSQSSRIDDITVALPDDEDVLKEQARVLEGDANSDLIVLSEITKIFENGKKAVNNLSIGIPPGECFGLLGINGAGKTTTLQILTAEFPPTSGDATLAGFSVTMEPEKTRRRIGYCPQFDALYDYMTGREHVELYAQIKGVPKNGVKVAAAACLAEVGLSPEDCDRLSAEYSGGMKRRLSLACALIGQPQIVFLDECTTGVDPVARREIWQVISNMVTQDIGKKPAVILTTHSMEECEALCPRIGIMANGRLRCLGSAQHLKNRFGQGFQIEMKVDIIDKAHADYKENLRVLSAWKGRTEDEEEPPNAEDVFFNLEETRAALRVLTNDSFLADMVQAKNQAGFGIWRDATSVTGCPLDELAAFATSELRLRLVEAFLKTTYPDCELRERQDSKVRYEVPSKDVRISSIFASIESNKGRLRLSDYGVSQTSLEQVFNLHAAEAERLKQGRIDG